MRFDTTPEVVYGHRSAELALWEGVRKRWQSLS
jgi:hypothetical protein